MVRRCAEVVGLNDKVDRFQYSFGESAGEVYLKATLEPVRKTDSHPAHQLGARCDPVAQGSPEFQKKYQASIACRRGLSHRLAGAVSKLQSTPNVADQDLGHKLTRAMGKADAELV